MILSVLSPMLLFVPQTAQAARLEQWLPFKFSEGVVTDPKIAPERKVGFVNIDGKTIIEAKFDAARPFSEGLAAVRVKGKWGFIDHSGTMVIEAKFEPVGVLDYPGDDPIDFSEGLSAVRLSNGSVGFIDKEGKFAFAKRFNSAREFSEGLAPVQDLVSGKWGYIDRLGNYVIKPKYTEARSFYDNRAAVKLSKSLSGSITSSGKGNGDRHQKSADGHWGYIDQSDRIIIPAKYHLGLDFHEKLALVLSLNGGVYTGSYIDTDGKTVIGDINCHGGNFFSEGLAPVPIKDFKVGYIDRTGKTIIAPQFQEARPFSDGFAVVRIDSDHWGLIDKSGKLLFSRSNKS